MILLVDNYDSFVYNLARYLEELGQETRVVRNDAADVDELLAAAPQGIVVSPGPCTPDEAGISLALIRQCIGRIPLLGVCLGHQALAAALGGRVVRAPEPVHGRTSDVYHDGSGLLAGLPVPFPAMRYHSLIVDEATLPGALRITARTADGIPMAVAHRSAPAWGVQFHPESILTAHGHRILARFLERAGAQAPRILPSGDLPPPQEPPPPPVIAW